LQQLPIGLEIVVIGVLIGETAPPREDCRAGFGGRKQPERRQRENSSNRSTSYHSTVPLPCHLGELKDSVASSTESSEASSSIAESIAI
jgi:hypothetical protein